MRLMSKVIIILCAVTLSGCAGAIFFHPKTHDITSVSSYKWATKERVLKGEADYISSHHPFSFSDKITVKRPTRFTDRLCGVVIGVIVPIPLLLPVCRDSTTYVFEDGVVVKVEDTHIGETGAFCMGIPGIAAPGGKFCRYSDN